MGGLDPRWALAIGVGGVAGALGRLGLAEAVSPAAGFPWPTLVANVIGAALLGLLVRAVFWRKPIGLRLAPVLGTGFCGALTTFSAFQLEVVLLLERGDVGIAIAYVVASLVAGLAAVLAGDLVGARVAR